MTVIREDGPIALDDGEMFWPMREPKLGVPVLIKPRVLLIQGHGYVALRIHCGDRLAYQRAFRPGAAIEFRWIPHGGEPPWRVGLMRATGESGSMLVRVESIQVIQDEPRAAVERILQRHSPDDPGEWCSRCSVGLACVDREDALAALACWA